MFTRIIPALIYGIIFYICTYQQNIIFLNILLTFFIIQLNIELYNITRKSQSIISGILMPIVYIILPIIILQKIKLEFGYNYLLFLILITWTNDVSAFVIGKKMGKHKLSNISPNKTIEGFLGSLMVSIIMCYYLFPNLNIELNMNPIYLGLLISLSCNIGDLFESFIKRKFKKKDSGKIMLGHGGMLDRLDSLLLSVPLFYLILIYSN